MAKKAAENKSSEAKKDFMDEIGRNLNSKNAAEIFGEDNVARVFEALGRTGVYGEIPEHQWQNGVIIPKGENDLQKEQLKKINKALGEL